ncbi:ABC transporter permease [Chloroflexi bacterium]|nr:ABC transporter permease [Chloroflexota bacterium]|tara:strand:+ start:825 stop:1754 length:930 start_codon:yes stop_codon:yes gene_type:complete
MSQSSSHLKNAVQRLMKKKIAVLCILILIIIYVSGLLASIIAPYDYTAQDYSNIKKPPSFEHIMGTDRAGRDVFTRVLWGVQNTAIITFVALITGGLIIGVGLGLLAGYKGGKIDSFIMRIGEISSSFPDILLVIILAATLRPRILDFVRYIEDSYGFSGLVKSGIADYLVVSLALVSFGWIGTARLMRAQVLSIKENQFVESARSIGASTNRILFVHLLPNSISPLIVSVTMGMGALVGTEIILSWLGLGIQPPRPSLGRMLLEGGSISVIRNEPWLLIGPGAIVFMMVLCWNLLGDALNDVLNPRTR